VTHHGRFSQVLKFATVSNPVFTGTRGSFQFWDKNDLPGIGRIAQGSKNGWIKPICDRLVLKRDKRSEKNGVRTYASEQAVENRAIFNKIGTWNTQT
jgi:hypothetical protein